MVWYRPIVAAGSTWRFGGITIKLIHVAPKVVFFVAAHTPVVAMDQERPESMESDFVDIAVDLEWVDSKPRENTLLS